MSFTPFDDSQTKTRFPEPSGEGYDTSTWDNYRQGVEITNEKFRFLSTQPKFWAGVVGSQEKIITYGQPQGYVEEDPVGLGSKFKDLPLFDPSAYIVLGPNYPLPIVFNDGPIEQTAATIEPLAIPFKKHSNEGPYYAHAIRGELEDGNDFDNPMFPASSRIEQFVDVRPPTNVLFFLDEGGGYFGNIRRDQYIAGIDRRVIPFDDNLGNSPDVRLQTTNSFMHMLIKNSLNAVEEDELLPYAKKSASAGYSYYGRDIGLYGTDSVAFGGWIRGS